MGARSHPNTRSSRELIQAIRWGTPADVRAVFEKYETRSGPPSAVDPNTLMWAWGQTVLAHAVWLDKLDIACVLLERGADPLWFTKASLGVRRPAPVREENRPLLEAMRLLTLKLAHPKQKLLPKVAPHSLLVRWLSPGPHTPLGERILAWPVDQRARFFDQLLVLGSSPNLPSDVKAAVGDWPAALKGSVSPLEEWPWWEALVKNGASRMSFRSGPGLGPAASPQRAREFLETLPMAWRNEEVLGRWEIIRRLPVAMQEDLLWKSPVVPAVHTRGYHHGKLEGGFLLQALAAAPKAGWVVLQEAMAVPEMASAIRHHWEEILAVAVCYQAPSDGLDLARSLVPRGTNLPVHRFSCLGWGDSVVASEGRSLLDGILENPASLKVGTLGKIMDWGFSPEIRHLNRLTAGMTTAVRAVSLMRWFFAWVDGGLVPTEETWKAIPQVATRALVRERWLEKSLEKGLLEKIPPPASMRPRL